MGGTWFHTDLEMNNLLATKKLIKANQAFQIDPIHMPLKNNCFDYVVSLDIIEHLEKDIACLHEIHRILKEDGTLVLSVPAIGPFYIVNHLKRWFGMTPDVYGHVREGYTERKLLWMLDAENFTVIETKTYAKFFTELIELLINVFYNKLRSRKKDAGYKGSITPSSDQDVKKNQKILFLYKFIYPFTWLISKLDHFLLLNKGYAFLIIARKRSDKKTEPAGDTHPTF
jgi:SAM-dependent methyltransferase